MHQRITDAFKLSLRRDAFSGGITPLELFMLAGSEPVKFISSTQIRIDHTHVRYKHNVQCKKLIFVAVKLWSWSAASSSPTVSSPEAKPFLNCCSVSTLRIQPEFSEFNPTKKNQSIGVVLPPSVIVLLAPQMFSEQVRSES